MQRLILWVFQRQDQFQFVDGFADVLGTVLSAMTADALHNRAFKEVQLVGVDELDWLHLAVLVMASAFLASEGTAFSLDFGMFDLLRKGIKRGFPVYLRNFLPFFV